MFQLLQVAQPFLTTANKYDRCGENLSNSAAFVVELSFRTFRTSPTSLNQWFVWGRSHTIVRSPKTPSNPGLLFKIYFIDYFDCTSLIIDCTSIKYSLFHGYVFLQAPHASYLAHYFYLHLQSCLIFFCTDQYGCI